VGVLLFIGALLFNPETTNTELSPAFIGGIGGIMAVIVMVPFMFVGFDVIPQAAEEMNLTRPNIGKFLIVSLIVAVIWYVAVIWSVGVTLPLALAETSSLGTADAMETAWQGKWAGVLLVIGGVLGIMSSWNAFLIGGSRLLYAMSKAHMLPAFLGKLHPKHKTPINAILLIGGLATLAPLFGRKMLVWIVTAGGFGVVIAYTLVAVSFLVLRYREP
ncbi:APC family permease, partial [Psychrobacter sp. 1U2]